MTGPSSEHNIFKPDEIPSREISDPAVLSKNPLVSVKMITYNHAPYISQAIEGVLQQKTDFPFELVIGEDCSTDGTREIVFEYQKKYPDIIRVITSDENVGAKKNSYRTETACRGNYIAFCEGDDYWHRANKLRVQTEFMESHPQCGLVYSDYDCNFVEKQITIKSYNEYKKRNLPDNPTISDFVMGRGGILGGLLTCTVMVKQDLLKKIVETDPFLHCNSYFLMGDTQKWAEISNISKIHYIDKSLATHNLIAESATRSRDRRKRIKFYISGTEMLLYLCKKYSLSKDIYSSQKMKWFEYSFELAFLDRDLKSAEITMRQCHNLPIKYYIKYYGMKNIFFYVLLKSALRLRRSILPNTEGFTL